MKIAYLGPVGSYSHAVAKTYQKKFPMIELLACRSIGDCLQKVDDEHVSMAVVPIENTIEGTVNPTLDYLYHQGELYVQAERIVPIQHALLVSKTESESPTNIQKIYSHPQALAQCQTYCQRYYPQAEFIPVSSTSAAAAFLAETQSTNSAAIASPLAAELYRLQIVSQSIQEVVDNETRFWLVGKNQQMIATDTSLAHTCKAAICLTLPNDGPGYLAKVLTIFHHFDFNLSKIESRPLKTNLGAYFFLIEVDMSNQTVEALGEVVTELEKADVTVQMLGQNFPIFVGLY